MGIYFFQRFFKYNTFSINFENLFQLTPAINFFYKPSAIFFRYFFQHLSWLLIFHHFKYDAMALWEYIVQYRTLLMFSGHVVIANKYITHILQKPVHSPEIILIALTII